MLKLCFLNVPLGGDLLKNLTQSYYWFGSEAFNTNAVFELQSRENII